MTINGISGGNTQTAQAGMLQATDSYSRNIQNQIANAQKQLQELSSNEEMTLEEKMKKRQEIQQQISDLNIQLRQHQMEQRKEKQQAKGTSMDDMLGGTNGGKSGSKSTGLSQAGMTAMISADTSIKQAKVQGSVATSMEGRAGVLESEIKNNHGSDVTKKKEELADVTQKAQAATASQMNTLAEASKTLEEAAKAENTTGKTAKSDAEEEKKQDGISGTDAQEESTGNIQQNASTQAENAQPSETKIPETQAAVYTHVDVRL